MRRNEATVFAALFMAWLLLVGWQAFEHQRVIQAEKSGLRTQASATSIAISAAVRTGRRFIPQERLENILRELSKTSGLESMALLNANHEVVASAGRVSVTTLPYEPETWTSDGVTFITPVDFGDQFTSTTIVMPSFRPGPGPGPTSGTLQQRFPPPPQGERRPNFDPRSSDDRTSPSQADRGIGRRDRRDGRRGGQPPFRQPFGMTNAQFEELSRSRGLHGFLIKLSRADYDRSVGADFWQRVIAAAIAALAAGGLGIAWHQAQKSARLQLRLTRASQMNMHLQELNLAAAGLAHETRNPLNIIRGLAQLITQQPSSAEIHSRAQDIAQEVDRVTSRLNEFINYSRPPEPRPAPLNFRSVVLDVVRALETDMIDKEVRFEPDGIDGSIEADQALLRQMLFNLLLNAVQAVGRGGVIRVGLHATGSGEAAFEVRDNGPGVPRDQREQVFRPYFTTREDGTGLGLAIVRQIALAHQWEIECIDGNPGARFRIRGVKLVSRSAAHAESASPPSARR